MPIIIFNIINKIAPGMPSIPINIEVKIFNPIWKLNIEPIKFIIYIKSPPKIEFNINLHILLIGKINILPIKNIKNIHANIAIKLFVSKLYPPRKFIFSIPYAIPWTNITLSYFISNF